MSKKIALIIPARYGSTRFPGKPLAQLGDKTVLEHVYAIATAIKAPEGSFVTRHVATDDTRIAAFCEQKNIPVLMTPTACKTGTDRVMAAATQLSSFPDIIMNLQGDAPFTPPDFVDSIVREFLTCPDADIVTPVVRLTWAELDTLRHAKITTPFSGTTAVIQDSGRALWFSKNIIPSLRGEDKLRASTPDYSPIYRHIGLYGYTGAALKKFVALASSVYEELEGLEQLRALQAGMYIQTVTVDYGGRPAMTGIDSPEDLERARHILGF